MIEQDGMFSDIVKRERNRQQLTLKELSEKTDGKINPSYINRIEGNKQSNPSFEIVCELCEALNLNINEVFKSFGYSSLIRDYDQDAVFSIDDVIHLHKIKLPIDSECQGEFSENERLINKEEQEQLIKMIYGIFEYGLAKETDCMDKLVSIFKQLYVFREMQQKSQFRVNTFDVQEMDITYTIEFDQSVKKHISNLKDWEEALMDAIYNYGGMLRDLPSGILTLPIDYQDWIVQKNKNVITVLFKKSDIISL
ncbi:helix-turn-helix domain-containing protein [Bacillus tuaregi]|uniref:helix-turn-helix domain-containing protein n=1 Tax=Bacillus tuaregi TaxID=1816695 RepID=UPI0008F96488|nr:helix-turn-helix transcriptional regulator [Bacillus tuaregi]